jgi:methionine synthase II (cobalamin-independent)
MRAHPLAAGIATAIGSLPHRDAGAAAGLVLRCLPELPAAPQLPLRDPREQMIAQWAIGIPEIEVRADGTLRALSAVSAERDAPVVAAFDPDAHGGLLTFCDVAARQPVAPRRVKVQVTGPLTLALALAEAGVPVGTAFDRAAQAARAWALAVEQLVAHRLPASELVLFFDEPGLAAWRDGSGPIEHEEATDVLSGALAGPACTTGVHACGAGGLRIALDAGPDVVGVDVANVALEDSHAIARFLEGGGWVAWGAVPTDRPIGESSQPLWRALVDLWCELTRRGCDAMRLRCQALLTPACGLAGHGPSQAERAMTLARELGCRVMDQAAATKLTVGA